jgi:hypothetical protein
MFKCDLTGEISVKGESPVFITIEKRRKEYFGFRPKKGKFDRDRAPRQEFYSNEPEKIGEGWEIVRELKVKQSSLEKFQDKLEPKWSK